MSQEVVLITRDITTQKYDLLIPLWHCVGTGMDVNIHTHKTCVLTGNCPPSPATFRECPLHEHVFFSASGGCIGECQAMPLGGDPAVSYLVFGSFR